MTNEIYRSTLNTATGTYIHVTFPHLEKITCTNPVLFVLV